MLTRTAVVAVAAFLLVGTQQPANAATKTPCRSGTAPTLTATSAAKVYRVDDTYFGCLRSRNRARNLGTRGSGPGANTDTYHRFTLAGRFVAYASQSIGEDSESSVSVTDLRSGRSRAMYSGEPRGNFAFGSGTVTDLAVTERGALAWIVQNADAPTTYQVRIATESGRTRRIAVGAEIQPHSLRRKGATDVCWSGPEPNCTSLR